METCNAVLTFESVDKILWRDHSNETSLAILLHGTICFSILYKMKFGILSELLSLALLGILGLNWQELSRFFNIDGFSCLQMTSPSLFYFFVCVF